MNPTIYSLTPRTLSLLASISERLGEVNAAHLHHPSPLLRRAHRVSTIHATLALEANPLGRAAIAELIDGHSLAAPGTAELEVLNTMRLHDLLPELDPYRSQDMRLAHGELMRGLALDPGHYRTGAMEVLYGDAGGTRPVRRRRAAAANIPSQVEHLLHFVENDDAPLLITSCVLHFGLAHLCPFTAGNGRIARLWQKLVLMQQWPVFSFLPVEGFIQQAGEGYYAALAFAEEHEDCGGFITFMMERIDEALHELLMRERQVLSATDRMATFLMDRHKGRFTRKDYRRAFPELAPATASRDLAQAVAAATIIRHGTGRNTWYRRPG
ncbi:MAG: Fic family protein [Flavobacteriales bacterium]|nr:Fic family protein [Flavobacteriales bacterium]MCL4281971.1 Fic family protein [Flavobacteriales bacterium]